MTTKTTAPSKMETAPEPRVGRDELNLTEFPFALLASRPGKEVTYRMEFRDGAKEWIVEGSPSYGLPTAADVEVYVILMELTRQQGFPMQVRFTRHEVMKRLGWSASGHNYDRFVQSLDRLVAVTIRSKNAFYDAGAKVWERKKAFHILEEYDVTDSRQAREGEPSLFPSWVRWGQELYRNIQAGHIKSLDVDLFLSLESSITQALYRYLDAKRYDGKPFYRIGIKKLAWEHLGLSRSYFPSQIKRKLDVAHIELMQRGFLAGAEYTPMKNGEEMVVYRFARRSAPDALPAGTATRNAGVEGSTGEEAVVAAVDDTATDETLISRMVSVGVTPHNAVELARLWPEICARQLEYFPYRKKDDPAAVLVKSIRQDWSAPKEYEQAQARLRRAETAREKRTAVKEVAEANAAADTAFQAWWEVQPEAQRTEWTAEAEALLQSENGTLAEIGRARPKSPIYRRNLMTYLQRVSGYLASASDGDPN